MLKLQVTVITVTWNHHCVQMCLIIILINIMKEKILISRFIKIFLLLVMELYYIFAFWTKVFTLSLFLLLLYFYKFKAIFFSK